MVAGKEENSRVKKSIDIYCIYLKWEMNNWQKKIFIFIIRSFHKNIIDKWTATRYLENVIINFYSIIILDNVWFSQMGDLKKNVHSLYKL